MNGPAKGYVQCMRMTQAINPMSAAKHHFAFVLYVVFYVICVASSHAYTMDANAEDHRGACVNYQV